MIGRVHVRVLQGGLIMSWSIGDLFLTLAVFAVIVGILKLVDIAGKGR